MNSPPVSPPSSPPSSPRALKPSVPKTPTATIGRSNTVQQQQKPAAAAQQKPAPQQKPSAPQQKPSTQQGKSSTNVSFKPLTPAQKQMLKTEYYERKNAVGRDKLYFSLKRQYGTAAPSQKAVNDWLLKQKVHQIHRRQFRSQTVTPIKNVRVPNQLWMADLIDLGKIPDGGYKWVLTVVDIFSKYAWARATKNKEGRTIALAMADILKSQKPRLRSRRAVSSVGMGR